MSKLTAAAAELDGLLGVAEAHGYTIDRLKLTGGAEVALHREAPPASPPAKLADESAAEHEKRSKKWLEREAKIARYAKELGERRARGLVDELP